MGWKGAIRSLNASAKRADKRRIVIQKQKLLQRSEELVEEHNDYLLQITGFHREVSEEINWEAIQNNDKPEEPKPTDVNELKAKNAYERFKPNFLNKILGNSEAVRIKLKNKIETAKQLDGKIYKEELAEYERDLETWKEDIKKAQQVKANNLKTIDTILSELDPFSDLIKLNIDTKLVSCDPAKWIIESTVNDTEIIVGYEQKLLKSGGVSIKPMTKGKLNSLIEDVFCSINVRVARELFALFPVEKIIVNTKSMSRSTNNGRLEPQLVLSCLYTRDKISDIDFDFIDPSDYIRMNTSYTSGFSKNRIVKVSEVLI